MELHRQSNASEVPVEKGGAQHLEVGQQYGSQDEIEHLDVNEKKVLRKMDLHIVPWLSLLYLLSFLDRTNIGNANLFGLSVDLDLNDSQYALCLAMFFLAYVLFEVPSNMVMKAWRPSMWLPIIMIAWGGVMIGMGFVHNFRDLLITRIFLGATEAGLFPGVSFFLTQWYRRYEINFRIALFFSAATAAGAFGGLLARLINLMDNVAGYEGWRWIFILEGILTVAVAAASFWMLYDYPDTAKFLTDDERKFVQRRLLLDNDGCSQEFRYKYVKDAFLDWKVWTFAFMFQGGLMPVYCFSLFSPTLTANLGYTAATAQLMSVPPYVVAAITTTGAGWLSDRMQRRGPITMVCASIGALGYLLLLVTPNPRAQYAGLFLAAAGCYPLIPLIVSFGANNAGGALKKGVAAAIIVSVGNAGGIISSFLYPKKEKPRYFPGHATNFAYCVATVIMAGFMTFYLEAQNKKKRARNAARTHDWTVEEKQQLEDRADANDWFMYTT